MRNPLKKPRRVSVSSHKSLVHLYRNEKADSLIYFLQGDEVSSAYRGPTAPATCLALSPHSSTNPLFLFAGSWDKSIHSWHARTRAPHRIYNDGHTDFVKALVTARLPSSSTSQTSVLVSSGADARIIIWAIITGEKLHVLRPNANPGGAVLGLAIPPPNIVPWTTGGADDIQKPHNDAVSITLFTAHTLPSIRRFSLTLDPTASLAEIAPDKPITVHETSVYGLHFDDDGDLWTASADGDVTCLAREKDWQVAEMRIKTGGGWVRGVAVDDAGGWVISVGRDEEVRVWDRGVCLSHPLFFSFHSPIKKASEERSRTNLNRE